MVLVFLAVALRDASTMTPCSLPIISLSFYTLQQNSADHCPLRSTCIVSFSNFQILTLPPSPSALLSKNGEGSFSFAFRYALRLQFLP